MRPVSRLVVAIAASLAPALAAGCGDSASSASTPPAPAPVATAATAGATAAVVAPPAPVTLESASSRYGRVLVDARGRALYLFTRDAPGSSRCRGACARAWPPYTVHAKGRAARGAHSSLLGLVRRSDGSRQLTYKGHPLYHYIGDRRPGQILCQDVEEYGGHWWVVSPSGAPVTT